MRREGRSTPPNSRSWRDGRPWFLPMPGSFLQRPVARAVATALCDKPFKVSLEIDRASTHLLPSKPKNPHPIVECKLLYRFFVKAAGPQRFNQVGQATGIFNRRWNRCTIEIRADRDAIYPNAVCQVVEVACQHVQRRIRVELGVGAHVVDGEVYSDDAVRSRYVGLTKPL